MHKNQQKTPSNAIGTYLKVAKNEKKNTRCKFVFT